jgi:hypothetical protein
MLIFEKTPDDVKLMAIFLAEMQKSGGEVCIEAHVDHWKVYVLGM